MAESSPSHILQFTRPTDRLLVPYSANIYDVEFQRFIISDYRTKNVIFDVGKTSSSGDVSFDWEAGEDAYRTIRYKFSEDVLRLPLIQTTLVFSVGDRPIREFRMIERHYFRDHLIKSFDFSFGYCIPGSTNTWDAVYSLPALDEAAIEDMINHPYMTQSDSFYFVDGALIMHNKAYYSYIREDVSQSKKKSYEDKFGNLAPKGSKLVYDDDDDLKSDGKSSQYNQYAAKKSGGVDDDDDGVTWSKDTDYL